MEITTLTGLAATLFSTVSFVPQAVKMVRTGDTSAVSTRMYAITVAGFALWLAYGLQLGAWPIVLANAICLALSSFILAFKISGPQTRAAMARCFARSGSLGRS